MAGETPPLSFPLHADVGLLAEPSIRFFAEITRDAIRRSSFKNVPKLEAAINDYLAKHNETASPFV